MKISDVIYNEEYIFSEADISLEFDHLSTDPNKADEGSLLIIPNSAKYPGGITLSRRPVAVICDSNAVLPENVHAIRVNDSRIALANACYRYEAPNLEGSTLIGVTGTNGKTGTATIIERVLLDLGHKPGFIGTGSIRINGETVSDERYSMTTPDPPLLYNTLNQMSKSGCDTIIMEVSSHSLSLEKVAPLRFDYALFTNFSAEHTDFHGDIEGYFSAKCKLFNQCKCGIFNIDDSYVRMAYDRCEARKISAGILWRGDVYASNIKKRGFLGVDYIYHGNGFSFKTSLGIPGLYNAYNSMLAATVLIDIGCKPCDVKRCLANISTIPGRFELIKDDISVIIDYAHTDAAFDNILKELHSLKADGRLTVVFGCGGMRDRSKRPRMAIAAEKYADRIIVTTDNSREEDPNRIISDIISGFENACFEINKNRKEAIRSAIMGAHEGDIVAIIGKGCEKYVITSEGFKDFDEKAIIERTLKERKARKNTCV
nr:UDP-N-acetylmuramoyl-L-alanyl-D-glutamate--2,6-diaminopimelate ligase [Oscillospiraceae bacterium]